MERLGVHRWLSSVVLFSLVMSGCAGGREGTFAPLASDEILPAAPPAEFSSSTGAIEGIVVGTSLLPIEGARVVLERLDSKQAEASSVVETKTARDGGFVFSLVPPDSYRLLASAEGYGNGSAAVEVTPETVSRVRIPMEDVPSNVPRSEVFPWRGFFTLTGTIGPVPVTAFGLGLPGQRQVQYFKQDLADGYSTTVAAVSWRSTSGFGSHELRCSLQAWDPPYQTNRGAHLGQGPSPILRRLELGNVTDVGSASQYCDYPFWDQNRPTHNVIDIGLQQPFDGHLAIFYYAVAPLTYSPLPDA